MRAAALQLGRRRGLGEPQAVSGRSRLLGPVELERRLHLSFRFAPPQGVLALQRRDRLYGVGASDGVDPCFGHPEVPDLADGDELLHRAGDILDRHIGVDAVLVEQVDALHA